MDGLNFMISNWMNVDLFLYLMFLNQESFSTCYI